MVRQNPRNCDKRFNGTIWSFCSSLNPVPHLYSTLIDWKCLYRTELYSDLHRRKKWRIEIFKLNNWNEERDLDWKNDLMSMLILKILLWLTVWYIRNDDSIMYDLYARLIHNFRNFLSSKVIMIFKHNINNSY